MVFSDFLVFFWIFSDFLRLNFFFLKERGGETGKRGYEVYDPYSSRFSGSSFLVYKSHACTRVWLPYDRDQGMNNQFDFESEIQL